MKNTCECSSEIYFYREYEAKEREKEIKMKLKFKLGEKNPEILENNINSCIQSEDSELKVCKIHLYCDYYYYFFFLKNYVLYFLENSGKRVHSCWRDG